jgi:CDP-4-dehydro-6-deoxyglucose reductase
MPWNWYDSTLIRIEDASPTTKRFWVELKSEDSFDFKAGQFVTMDLPIHEKRLKRWRSYSIANPPDKTNILEFCIVNLPGGDASQYFFQDIKIGDNIRFKGPSGGFYFPEKLNRGLVLICTGTGVAPYRSMLLDLINKRKEIPPIHLIFGTRFQEGVLYKDEFEKLERELADFKYSIVLSREDNWSGYKGYVHQVYLKEYLDQANQFDFYLCGWKEMIDEAVLQLVTKLKVPKNQIRYELYG